MLHLHLFPMAYWLTFFKSAHLHKISEFNNWIWIDLISNLLILRHLYHNYTAMAQSLERPLWKYLDFKGKLTLEEIFRKFIHYITKYWILSL